MLAQKPHLWSLAKSVVTFDPSGWRESSFWLAWSKTGQLVCPSAGVRGWRRSLSSISVSPWPDAAAAPSASRGIMGPPRVTVGPQTETDGQPGWLCPSRQPARQRNKAAPGPNPEAAGGGKAS